jgi:hypothetical protein
MQSINRRIDEKKMDLTYPLEELVEVALYDGLDNSSVDSG